MKKVLLSAIFMTLNYGFSQEKIPYIDLDEIKEKAAESGQKGEYENTLNLLEKVHKNDSSYCAVLTSRTYYLLQADKYEETIELANVGLTMDCEDNSLSFLINKGVAYENLEEFEKALEVYNIALRSYPKNAQLFFNKGIILEKANRLEEALEAFKRAVYYRPTYKEAHLRLGNISYKQEKLAQAMLSFNTYLLLEPDASGATDLLVSYNNLVISKNPNKANPNILISKDEKAFEMINLVLENKLALNENYKISSKINYPLIKQNHALLEQLKTFEVGDGFWSQTYVPVYKWIMENGRFEDFVNTLSFSVNHDEYQKIISKNTPAIKSFITDFSAKWEDILEKSPVRFGEDETDMAFSYYNNILEGIGKKNGDLLNGAWIFYNPNGRLFSQGSFDGAGKRTGDWTWFFENGSVEETSRYKDGKLNGETKGYHENGRLRYAVSYTDDQMNGEFVLYNEKGALMQKKYFKSGNLDGLYKEYFAVGEDITEFDITYVNGKIDGLYKEYYANGGMYSEIEYKNGLRDGKEKFFAINNNLVGEVVNEGGNPKGAYKAYYTTGQLKNEGEYRDGLLEGRVVSYHNNGEKAIDAFYKKGEITGTYSQFDLDGKLYVTYEYNKDKIIAYKFFDKTGKQIAEGSRKSGEFSYNGYYPTGVKEMEGLYNVSGGKTGHWKFYNKYGLLIAEGDFMEDQPVGEYKEYYPDGSVKNSSFYTAGMKDGYHTEYHPNKKLAIQGWFKNDQQVGEWRSYFMDGTLKAINYYHNGTLNGEQEYFDQAGNPERTSIVKHGNLKSELLYNKLGKIYDSLSYESKENRYTITTKHYNGKPNTVTHFVNGIKHGAYTGFDEDGNKLIEGNYLNGIEHGSWKNFYASGKLQEEKQIVLGEVQGDYIFYHENGRVENLFPIEESGPHGDGKSYHENGNLYMLAQQYYGADHGRKEFYNDSGKLELVRFFEYGAITGYSYLDENGKELPKIPLDNETGKITSYFDNGQKSREMEYKNGEVVGDYISYFYNGNVQSAFTNINGMYHGPRTDNYENGNKKSEKEYNYDLLHGISRNYYENGKIKDETTYLNGEKYGPASYYDQNGKLIKKVEYINGKIYSREI